MVELEVEIERTEDRWERLAGSRFVGPHEFREAAPGVVRAASLRLVDEMLALALAEAADEQGVIIDLRPNEFWSKCMTAALREDEDPDDWRVNYDRFAAMYIHEAMLGLVKAGLLAHRGNGDSHDERLTLPADAEE